MNRRSGGLVRRAAGVCARAVRRSAAFAWPLIQATAAATLAWLIAKDVFAHEDPFFAPIAAVIALNTSLGERGLNALRLLFGVMVGIAAGELTIAVLGAGYGRLALATFAAMAVAYALGGARIMIAQAAAGAILTVAASSGEAGWQRLSDAVIGAGVALVFTQFLFSPEPVALMRRAERAVLLHVAAGLRSLVTALERHDEASEREAMDSLGEARDHLTELARTRRASRRVVRHSLAWRSRMGRVVRESENAGQLDLLIGSCLILARTAFETTGGERTMVASIVRDIERAISDLAANPGDRALRQQVADRALHISGRFGDPHVSAGSALDGALIALRMIVADVMIFAGVAAQEARDALRSGDADLHVAPPPSAGGLPLDPRQWRSR
jgi:uncharacterized membrane protein YgaE (UPF0421/DUF939 family)